MPDLNNTPSLGVEPARAARISGFALQKQLRDLIKKRRLKRAEIPDLLRVLQGKSLEGSVGVDARRNRISLGLKNLFTSLIFKVFAVDRDLNWPESYKSRFDESGWRKIAHAELRSVSGCSRDEIRENLPVLCSLGVVSSKHFRERQSPEPRSFTTELWLRLNPDAIEEALLLLRQQKKHSQTKGKKPGKGPEKTQNQPSLFPPARKNLLLGVIFQHCSNWNSCTEKFFEELKISLLDIEINRGDRRKQRVPAAVKRLYLFLVQSVFGVDFSGNFLNDGMGFDRRGFRKLSSVELRAGANCTNKELRLAREFLQRSKILEVTHTDEIGQRSKSPLFRIDFQRLIKLNQQHAVWFRLETPVAVEIPAYSSEADVRERNPPQKGQIKPEDLRALIPQSLFVNSTKPLEPVLGNDGSSEFPGASLEKTMNKKEAGASLFFSVLGKNRRPALPDLGNNQPGLTTLSLVGEVPGITIMVIVPETAAYIAMLLKQKMDVHPDNVFLGVKHLRQIARLVNSGTLNPGQIADYVEKRLYRTFPADWMNTCDAEVLLKHWYVVQKELTALPKRGDPASASDFLRVINTLEQWFEAQLLRFQRYPSWFNEDPHRILFEMTCQTMEPTPEQQFKLRAYFDFHPEAYVKLSARLPWKAWLSPSEKEHRRWSKAFRDKVSSAEKICFLADSTASLDNQEDPSLNPDTWDLVVEQLNSRFPVPVTTPGTFTLVAGLSGRGKTLLCAQILLHYALKGRKIHYLDPEHFHPSHFAMRLVANALGQPIETVSPDVLQSPPPHLRDVWQRWRMVNPRSFRLSLDEIIPPDFDGLVILDGMQNAAVERFGSGARYPDLLRFGQEVQSFAKRRNLAVLATAQLSIKAIDQPRLGPLMISECPAWIDLVDQAVGISAIRQNGQWVNEQFLEILKPSDFRQIPITLEGKFQRFTPRHF